MKIISTPPDWHCERCGASRYGPGWVPIDHKCIVVHADWSRAVEELRALAHMKRSCLTDEERAALAAALWDICALLGDRP